MIERPFSLARHTRTPLVGVSRSLGRGPGAPTSPDAPRPFASAEGFLVPGPMTPTHRGGTDDRHDDEGPDPTGGGGAGTSGDQPALARRGADLTAEDVVRLRVRSAWNTHSPAPVPSGCGRDGARRGLRGRPGSASPAARPWRWSRPDSGRSTSRAGRSPPTPTSSCQTYPDQSLYPANSVPAVVRRMNNALMRADQIAWPKARTAACWPPIVADAEAGFGGRPELLRADAFDDRGRGGGRAFRGPARLQRRSVGTWAGRCWCPRINSCGPSPRRGWRRTCSGSPRSWSLAPTRWRRRCSPATSTSRDRAFTTGERTHEGSTRDGGLDAAIARARRTPRSPTCSGARRRRRTSTRRAGSPTRSARGPRQAPRVQLLAVVQLEAAPGRHRDRAVPEGARLDGLPVPVHHARGLPRPEREHVRARARLRRRKG